MRLQVLGKVCSIMEKLEAKRMLDLNLAGMVPQGKVAGSRQWLGASSQAEHYEWQGWSG